MAKSDDRPRQNGKLSIPLPFEKALKAATEVPAESLPAPPKRKPRAKKNPAKP